LMCWKAPFFPYRGREIPHFPHFLRIVKGTLKKNWTKPGFLFNLHVLLLKSPSEGLLAKSPSGSS
jgi:hypothetical protein